MDLFSLLYIDWYAKPEIFSIGGFSLRWYGLLFATAFLIGYRIIEFIYKTEGIPKTEADKVAMYMVGAVVIGARLGHVLFYQPDYYLTPEHFIEILKIWEGGLASHGASIGIIIAMILYYRSSRQYIKGVIWMLDRIILTIPLGGACIRIGNLFNSEIYGKPVDLPFAFIYHNDAASGMLPRHPTQIYEALGYIIIFFILFRMYKKLNVNTPKGYLFGWFLIMLFGLRFLVEFVKENQVDFEKNLPLNLGQLLSIPFILAGIYLVVKSRKEPIVDEEQQ